MGKLTIPDSQPIPPGIKQEVEKFVESLEDRISYINAVKIESDQIYVLGYNLQTHFYYEIIKDVLSGEESEFSFKNINVASTSLAKLCTLGLYALTKGVQNRKKQRKMYYQKVKQYDEANNNRIENMVKNIRVYQGDIAEAEKELGPLERADTGSAERFLKKNNILNLRIRAYQLGADAIVHYVETSGSCIGTPIRKKKD